MAAAGGHSLLYVCLCEATGGNGLRHIAIARDKKFVFCEMRSPSGSCRPFDTPVTPDGKARFAARGHG